MLAVLLSSLSVGVVSPVRALTPVSTIYLTPNATPQLAAGKTITFNVMGDMLGASANSGVNGWDLVFTDNDPTSAFLSPLNVSVSGNLLTSFGNFGELINCVNGGVGFAAFTPGNVGCDPRDGPGVVHTAAVLEGGVPGTPVSGLIARMTFSVLSSGQDTVGILSPCPHVVGCDILTDGTAIPVNHKTLAATYGTTSPDFAVTTNPPLGFLIGSNTSTINATSFNSYNAKLTVTTDVYPTTGLTVLCGPFSPSTIPANGGSTSTCTINSSMAGNYVVTANVTDGTKFHLAPMTVKVGGFQLQISGVNFPTTNTGSTPIRAISLNGFGGTISVSTSTMPSTGLTVACPTGFTITATASASGVCNLSSSMPGLYVVKVNGTYSAPGGVIVQSAAFYVNVGDFSITGPSQPVSMGAGVSGSFSVNLKALFLWDKPVLLYTNATPAGLTVNCPSGPLLPGFRGNTEYCSLISSTPGTYSATVNAVCGPNQGCNTIVSHSIQFTVTVTEPVADFAISVAYPTTTMVGNSANVTISVNPVNGFAGTVSLTDMPATGLTCGFITPSSIGGSGIATVSCSASVAGSYPLSITGTSGSLSHTTPIILAFVADFTMTATSPAPATTGSTMVSIITVTGNAGFNGAVSLFANTFGTTLACGPVTPSVIYGSGTALLSCSSTSSGTFSVRVEGTSGSLTHFAFVSFTVIGPDFQISVFSPAPVQAGSTAVMRIVVNGTNSFMGVVALSDTPLPFDLNCGSITPTSITDSGKATLSCSSPHPGFYGVTITGTSGSLIHGAFGSFFFTPPPDFNLYGPQELIVVAGSSTTGQVSVYSSGPLSSPVTIRMSAKANETVNGLTVAIDPTSLVLTPPFGSGQSTLVVTTLATTPPGNYTIIITGQLGSLTHTFATRIRVIAAPVITLTPDTGPVGTKMLVQGSNFLASQYPGGQSQVTVTFDDQFVGFTYFAGTKFNFTFNVPVSQNGSHTVKAYQFLYSYSGTVTLTAIAEFQVTSGQGQAGFTIDVQSGTIYFPGGSATIFVQTIQNGVPTTLQNVQLTVTLTKPNGSTQTLALTRVGTGLYKASWAIPSTASLGTYAVTVSAHSPTLGDASALSSFEVQPTWLQSNRNNILTGATIAGMLGLAAFAWRKGYLRREQDQPLWNTP